MSRPPPAASGSRSPARSKNGDGAIRINASLADPASGEAVWSGAIPRSASEPGGLAGAAAAVVGSIVQCTLAGANDAGAPLPLDVLSGYARTCELGYRGQSAEGVRVARELTRRAPDFAAGWFALSHHAHMQRISASPSRTPSSARSAGGRGPADRAAADAQDGYASKFIAMDPARISGTRAAPCRAIELDAGLRRRRAQLSRRLPLQAGQQ